MKKVIKLFLVVFCFFHAGFASCQNREANKGNVTTFILVRHGEKADNSPDTYLSEAGNNRAKALARLLSPIKVDAIFTTTLNRTKQTAQFVAANNQLPIQTYDMNPKFPELTDELVLRYAGKTVMIVGHSNTLPINIERLTKNKIFIPEEEFDHVFIIQVHSDGSSTTMLHLKYGE